MTIRELINQWRDGKIAEGVYGSYELDGNTNIVVEVESECITFKYLEGRFVRCETYHEDGIVEEWFE